MRRRKFITLLGGAAIAWPFAVRAQQPPTKVCRLGYLAPARIPKLIEVLQTGLRELGYVEGRNLTVEYRFGGQQSERLDTLASELVQLGPDAIVTVGTSAAFATKRATTTISIVMAPVQRNLLYTGVTRGKRLVVLVGQKKAVAICCAYSLEPATVVETGRMVAPATPRYPMTERVG